MSALTCNMQGNEIDAFSDEWLCFGLACWLTCCLAGRIWNPSGANSSQVREALNLRAVCCKIKRYLLRQACLLMSLPLKGSSFAGPGQRSQAGAHPSMWACCLQLQWATIFTAVGVSCLLYVSASPIKCSYMSASLRECKREHGILQKLQKLGLRQSPKLFPTIVST